MRVPTFADKNLSDRIERQVVAENHRFAETTAALYPEVGPASLEIAGGIAIYAGPGSPVNGAWALGTSVQVTAGEIAEVERFFVDRGERPAASVSPFADPTVVGVLSERGWCPRCFENVLVREVIPGEALPEPDPHVDVRLVRTPEDRELWADCVARGFAAPETPTPAEVRLAHAAAANPDATLLMAHVDGQAAGTGEFSMREGVAWLSADTTLPAFRGRGVQRSLQRARLAMARDAGCDLAVSESIPGSVSQRNMERLGFRLAYVRVECIAPLGPGSPVDALEGGV